MVANEEFLVENPLLLHPLVKYDACTDDEALILQWTAM